MVILNAKWNEKKALLEVFLRNFFWLLPSNCHDTTDQCDFYLWLHRCKRNDGLSVKNYCHEIY